MMKITEIDEIKNKKLFSICTLVTNLDEYQEMITSFEAAGFNEDNSEFIYIDNSEHNKYDAYDGLNKSLNVSQGQYVILCHQDVLIKYDGINELKKRIEEMNQHDENWAVLGNAGHQDFYHRSVRITDPWGDNRRIGKFPFSVCGVDENFMVIKSSANLAFSRDIGGFHLYGTDICQIAKQLGYTSYVIDFHLYHKSGGNVNYSFYDNKQRFINKYRRLVKPIIIRSPATPIYIYPHMWVNRLLNRKFFYRLKRSWDKFRHK